MCRTLPINLLLDSTAPYDPETGLVTVSHANFTVPSVVEETPCNPLVGGAVNDLIAGHGHSLSLTLEGELEVPEPPGQPSVTTLAVSPSGTSLLSDPVTLTATVAPGPEAETEDVPTGLVDFLDGDTVLGTVALVGGEASLATTSLGAGARSLRARYRGGDGIYGRSSSATIPHTVTANPAIVADVPEHLYVGGPGQEFDVTVVNTGFGVDVVNARIDITIERVPVNVQAPLTPERVVLEHQVGDDWETVVLAQPTARVLVGSIDAATGFLLPQGAEVTRRMRISLPGVGTQPVSTVCLPANVTCPGPVKVALDVVPVDPEAGTPASVRSPAPGALATGSVEALIVASVRRPTLISLGSTPVSAPVVRQGATFDLPAVRVGPHLGQVWPTGDVAVELNGRRLGIRRFGIAPIDIGWPDAAPINPSQSSTFQLKLPLDTPLGDHTLVVHYLGNPSQEPSSTTVAIRVAPARGVLFECARDGVGGSTSRYTIGVEASSLLPAYRAVGSEVALGALSVEVSTSRSISVVGTLDQDFGTGPQQVGELHTVSSVVFDFAGRGSGGAVGLERTGTSMTSPSDDAVLDQTVTFSGEYGSVHLDGEPGATAPISLDRLAFTTKGLAGAPDVTVCTPVGEPVHLGSVTLTGTDLGASLTEIRQGDSLALDAVSLPPTPGFIEFRSGTTSIGLYPVDPEGRASMTISSLTQGVHQVTARFLGGLAIPSTTSDPIEVMVLPPLDCKPFALEGSAAVVRLVYMDLLGRCPDQAGFDYWVHRLNGGVTQAAFARSISATPEAVGMVVDDAYLTMLGRRADAAGRAFWVGRLQASGRYDRLLADLGSSDEFWSKAGSSNAGFVIRVYGQLLSRTPDQAGEDFWVGRLQDGVSRVALIVQLANLDEPLGVLVGDAYEEILGRKPNGAEKGDGIAHLRATGSRSGLYADLIGTAEFFDRAQDFPNPED